MQLERHHQSTILVGHYINFRLFPAFSRFFMIHEDFMMQAEVESLKKSNNKFPNPNLWMQ
jgi:hypothetical protein